MASQVDLLKSVVGKTVSEIADIGDWKDDIYGFTIRFTDGTVYDLRVTNSESIDVRKTK